MGVIKYNKYNFILENFPEDMLKESTEFGDMQMGQLSNPLGPGYGFAQDPSLSIYSDDSSPYIDNYQRLSRTVQDLARVMKSLYGAGAVSISKHKLDYFLEDVEDFQNLKILRIFVNQRLELDVFISFSFMEEEFFGVYRNFNGMDKPKLDTDLFSDPRFSYIDNEYRLKASNYFYKILYNWFIPSPGDYKVLTDELEVKNSLGENYIIKKGKTITVKGYNTDADDNAFLMLIYRDDIYKIIGNNFYFFKYWCKKI
jgi:hypothetical protein